MKVIICGAGRVGYGIAERLSEEGNDVSVIDMQPSLIAAITESLDVSGVVGHGAHLIDHASGRTGPAHLIFHALQTAGATELFHALGSGKTYGQRGQRLDEAHRNLLMKKPESWRRIT